MTNQIRRTLFAALAIVAAGSAVALALTPEQIAARYQAEGYTRIEIKQGLTQTKVEAIRGTEKIEVVYDRATGAILKSETERATPGERGHSSTVLRSLGLDFVETLRSGNRGRWSDDHGADDHRGRGRGSDDRGFEDRGARGHGAGGHGAGGTGSGGGGSRNN
jgi:hypothetical protein